MEEQTEFITVTWIKDNIPYQFKGRTPFYPGELGIIDIKIEDAKEVLKYSYFLTCRERPYDFYHMLFFDSTNYDKIKHIIEPNRRLKFKDYVGGCCQYIYSFKAN